MSNIITGSCQCGNIEIEFDNKKVISAHHCYCKDCQRSTGTGKATILYKMFYKKEIHFLIHLFCNHWGCGRKREKKSKQKEKYK